MKKIALFVVASGLTLIGGVNAANATVALVSVTKGPTGSGFNQVATFESQSLGDPKSFIDGGGTFTGDLHVVQGRKGNLYAAPTGDTGHYLTLSSPSGAMGSLKISYGKTEGKFGIYWGSPDSYNTLTFYLGSTVVGTFKGTQIEKSNLVSGFATFKGGFDSVVLSSSHPNFEVDNISVSGVPELSTWAMMLAGFGGLGLLLYNRTRRETESGAALMGA